MGPETLITEKAGIGIKLKKLGVSFRVVDGAVESGRERTIM